MEPNGKFYIDTSINNFIEKSFHSLFKRTRKLHNDYWYIWAKSGLLDYACLKIRNKYRIKILDEKTDYQTVEAFVGDESVAIDTYKFFDSWNNKAAFKKDLESLVYQLRLPRSAYGNLFHKIFYNTPLKLKETWEGYDTESVFHITVPLSEDFLLLGFTKTEITKIRKMIISDLAKKLKRHINDKEDKVIENWCRQLERNIRVFKNKKLIYLVIEQMKKYKTFIKDRDDDNNISEQVRQTSEKCAANISAVLPGDEHFDAVAYRKMAQRLQTQFPILHEYIET